MSSQRRTFARGVEPAGEHLMRPARRLELRRESLSDLHAAELRAVAGGTHVRTDCNCLTHGYTCDYCPLPTLPMGSCTGKCVPTIIPTR